MTGLFDGVGRRLLFTLDPETAHGLSIKALKCGLPPVRPAPKDPRLAIRVAGIDLPNPLGMAAGYDKNGEVPDAILSLGFGFAEIGSVTPRPQPGNPKPRIFRLERDGAVINRLGFNNEGHDACAARLVARHGRSGIVGVNIGANKDSTDRIADYEAGVKRFAPLGSYLTVNISSPNTPGLRNMQARTELGELLARVVSARGALADAQHRARPIFLKIAPDLSDPELEDIAAEVLAHPIEGVIVSNTTLSRDGLVETAQAKEAGGLSGKPLFARSTIVLAKMRRLLGSEIAIVGVGGVDSAETALEKIRAGADLVQLYTGLIYGGLALPGRILRDMLKILDRDGIKTVAALRDTRTGHWAAQPL
ncbi:quinone-dependent dihydroorotate dehydrogenase [Mesorhizobium sp. LHD-90]|uniref:quinone-dependent dihydroorotate dehydrogenase n=1 Tax=Mesorhizobium sp. LHD-90 TaxID=3071414 RepID=UPI0027E0D166|nr:quinone-dependent dihydroorotate dehydrogenase [Mesorhizobium sp. LHD-90]MDQ6437610.1 quinone-dependent dihydroorotate dehydrogenase [Mesorhizobium sp. LHD-90]